ncbi:hypothetical protein [Magnetofaba australis]|uniref:hypothetical protein n=1 Tax=Magnetofaba australis TaxID=1472297 RepID=UPI000A19CC50|nr:hypothetical protein [Magnetofaba australis]
MTLNPRARRFECGHCHETWILENPSPTRGQYHCPWCGAWLTVPVETPAVRKIAPPRSTRSINNSASLSAGR